MMAKKKEAAKEQPRCNSCAHIKDCRCGNGGDKSNGTKSTLENCSCGMWMPSSMFDGAPIGMTCRECKHLGRDHWVYNGMDNPPDPEHRRRLCMFDVPENGLAKYFTVVSGRACKNFEENLSQLHDARDINSPLKDDQGDCVDISKTAIPMEERTCLKCGMLGCCPSMLKDKLTDLRGRKDTPGSCNRWRDQMVMNPQRNPLDPNAPTCIDCDGLASIANGRSGTKVICSIIHYDGKQIATVESAPACLLFHEKKLLQIDKDADANGDKDAAEAMGTTPIVAAAGNLERMVPVSADSVMVGAISEDEGSESKDSNHESPLSVIEKAADNAVSSPERLQVLAAEIRFLTRLTVENAIAIGQRLNEAKALVPGSWGVWLKVNVNYSQDTAERFMNIATEYADSATLRNSGLGVSALCELMALPKPEREYFLDEVHLVDGREKRAPEMSVRELRAAIARRKRHEEELEAQLEAKRRELDQAAADKSNALNALRDKLTTEHSAALGKLIDMHGKVVADLKEDLALKEEEISGMEKPDTITVEVDKVVPPPDYEAALEDAKEAATLRREVEATEAMIRQVLTRPESMQLMDARLLGAAVDSFLQTARAFPFSGPVLFAGGKAMRTDVFKVHLDKLGLWLAASYTALEGKVLEVPHAGMDD